MKESIKIKHSNIQLTNPHIHEYPAKIPARFNTILIDPPWSKEQKGRLGAENHYDLMSMQEIMDLPINDLLTDDAHVWLWMTNAVLPNLPELMEAWGLTYRSIYTWVKPRLGLGNYLRNSTEQLILATKGKAPILFKGQMNWGFMPLQDHSHKPEEIYETIERCSPGPYLEMFARQKHPGWYAWGREIPSDIMIDAQPVPQYTENLAVWVAERNKEKGSGIPSAKITNTVTRDEDITNTVTRDEGITNTVIYKEGITNMVIQEAGDDR